MSMLEETILSSVPHNDWQLDVEPESEVQPFPTEALSQPALVSRSLAPDESTTPPPLHHILEALLFAATDPITSEQLCVILRGLTPSELDDTIRSMNLRYRRQCRPYTIVCQPTGYQLSLRSTYRFHLETLYGGVKEARFSQLAIETLAIVAYRQPLALNEVEGILGQPAGAPLRQLVRRGMIQFEGNNHQGQPTYKTTQRFLDYFSLSKVEDLPKADDLERL